MACIFSFFINMMINIDLFRTKNSLKSCLLCVDKGNICEYYAHKV